MWLSYQQKRIKSEIDKNIATVLKHGQYIMGPEVAELEYKLSRYVKSNYAVACSSGTDALLMSLMAHEVQASNYIILTTPFTFVSTAEVITLLGARPCFVDIDPDTFNIDPIKLYEQIQMLDKRNCKLGIIAVDLYGLPADYVLIKQIADFHKAFVIEDAAQSLGGDINGYKAGSLASIGCTSFFPSKPLGGYGDGGMCFTNSNSLYQKLTSIRAHGKGSDKYDNIRVGVNGRLDTIQAAVLLAKFEIFEEEITLRQEVAKRYNSLLKDINSIKLPHIPEKFKSAWAQYTVLFENEDVRNSVFNKLKHVGIDTAIYYPKPLHLQKPFNTYSYTKGDFPVSEMYSKMVLSLPIHPYLTFKEQKKIVGVIEDCVR